MEPFLLLALILLNGAFAMSEIALVSARRSRLEALASAGDHAAALALELGARPTRFLSTIQIGITSIGIMSGIVGEATVARPLAAWFRTLGVDGRASELGATAVVLIGITYTAIVLGELVPKRLGQLAPERVACLAARPIGLLAQVAQPFVHLLSASTSFVLRAIGQQESPRPDVTEAEIHAVLAEGSAAGLIAPIEHELARNVFRLDERGLASLMVPRGAIVWLDASLPADVNLGRIIAAGHGRYPVCKGSVEHVVGTIGATEVLDQVLRGAPLDLAAGLEPAVFVPESMSALALLARFRTVRTGMVFVMDEFGEVSGLATRNDVLACVIGELDEAGEDGGRVVRRDDGSLLVDGMLPVAELADALDLGTIEAADRGDFHTLAGLVMALLGRLPRTGDVVRWRGWDFEVVDMDGRRIDKVLATKARMPAP